MGQNEAAPRRLHGAAVRRTGLTDALFRAFFAEWAERGYAATRLDAVAARAGVSKATLYRRWGSKRALADEAIATIAVTATSAPDGGDLLTDVLALLRSFRRLLRHPLARRIVPDMHAELARGGEIVDVLGRITAERRARVGPLIAAAIARGELRPNIDPDLAADLVAAPIYWRMIATGGRADDDYLGRSAAAIVAALKAC